MKTAFFPILILLLNVSVASWAEQANRMDTVYVTASRTSADHVDIESQSGRVTVIKREDFEGDVATVADVLRKETGVQIRQLGGLGSFSSISVRGSTSNQVNIYLDGVLLNGAYGGSVDLSQFLLSAVEEIQIYRSNVPIQIGRSGIGGAINIKTRRSSSNEARELGLAYGSFGTQKAAYMTNQSFDQVDFLVAGEYLASENDFTLLNDNGTPLNTSDDRTEKRRNADFNQYDVLFSSRANLSKDFEFNATGQLFSKKQGVPDALNLADNDASLMSDLMSVNLVLDHWWKKDVTLAYDFFASIKQEQYRDLSSRVGLSINDDKGVSRAAGLGVKSSISEGANLVSLHLDSKYEEYSIENYFSGTKQDYSRLLVNASAQDEWISNSGDLTLNIGAHSLFNYDENDNAGDKDSEFNYSLQAGVFYVVARNLSFRFNVSRDIRIPQLNEKYGDRGFSVGNEDLQPETAINADIGIAYNSQSWVSSLTVFKRHLDDAIITIYDSRGVGKAQNASAANVYGTEFHTSYQFDSPWSLSLRSTFQNAEDTSDSRDFGGQSLPGIFDLAGLASVSYSHEFHRFSLEYEFNKDGFYDRSGIEPMPDIKHMNFIATWKQNAHKVEFSLENITNQKSQEINRFPGPGRFVFISYIHQI